MRWSFVGTLVAAGLLLILAGLQYRWLGQIGEADQARLRVAVSSQADQFARDFDREVTRAFLWLRVDVGPSGARDGKAYAERHAHWKQATAHPGLVKDVWLIDDAGEGLQRFDAASGTFRAAAWPADLSALRARLHEASRAAGPFPPAGRAGTASFPGPGRLWPSDMFDDKVPAFFTPILAFEPMGRGLRGMSAARFSGFNLVTLDLDYIRERLFPALARRHFGTREATEYTVVVSRRANPRDVVFGWPASEGGRSAGDATASLLRLRIEDVAEEDLAAMAPTVRAPAAGARAEPQRFQMFMAPPGAIARPDPADRPPPRRTVRAPWGGAAVSDAEAGAWRLVATHRTGSVDQEVATLRRRNLAVSGGILALLALNVVLIVGSARRARRFADRQLEFVAGVSHELRTPVAVICSAGENLADGVVDDRAMVRQYGRVVRDEGRRLAEMVEQVLDFAGTYSGRRAYRFDEATVEGLVQEGVASVVDLAREHGVEIETTLEPALPPLRVDRGAFVRALSNLLQNAIKHGGVGGWTGVRAAADPSRAVVRITVADRGPGIPPAERSLVFEPFFRGERALSGQVRGTGLGLSLVKRIVEGHGGTVSAESAPGGGATFTLTVPVAPGILPASGPAHGTAHIADRG